LVIAPFAMAVFNFAVAAGKDLQTVLICRFFAGLFGSAPLAVVAAVFSDMFSALSRGIAITLFSLTVFTGPLMAPFVGGFIVTGHLGWRWTEYIIGILVRQKKTLCSGPVWSGLVMLFISCTALLIN
jgi:DHA1 family multidrug resistance protein-like MFS transporter